MMVWAMEVLKRFFWPTDLGRIASVILPRRRWRSPREPSPDPRDEPSSSSLERTGQQQLMAACAARLRGSSGMVWVDFGGGASDNVVAMAEFIDLAAFEKIYIVDSRPSACAADRERWAGTHSAVEIVDTDEVAFALPKGSKLATLVTFSFSLSAMANFMPAADTALACLAEDGILGMADLFTSAKADLPNRQHGLLDRWFWRLVLDARGLDAGPERRAYLEHRMTPVFEFNSRAKTARGSFLFLRAPYCVWIGRQNHWKVGGPETTDRTRFPARASDEFEARRPPSFPPTFLYSLSWEDPREDDKALAIEATDTVLTLTSGGCNALDLILQGAKTVVAVDINPAQSYLLELKRAAVIRLPFEDAWKMFGEGIHPGFDRLLRWELAPFLSQGAANFWAKKARYFHHGLYYQGGMGRLLRAVRLLARVTRQERWIDRLVNAPTLEKQRELWFATVGDLLARAGVLTRISAYVFTNRVVLWFCAGVCKGQLSLIQKEESVYDYIVRCLNSTAEFSHLRDGNYFYRCCLTGRFSRDCCPRFLEADGFGRLKADLAAAERLLIRTGSFVDELNKRHYSKVILMDHVDWLDAAGVDALCDALARQIKPGGRVIWRSASRRPEYAQRIEKAGFTVRRIQTSEKYMDRVNMYASFYVAVRQ